MVIPTTVTIISSDVTTPAASVTTAGQNVGQDPGQAGEVEGDIQIHHIGGYRVEKGDLATTGEIFVILKRRVRHRVLLRSERIVLLRSFTARNIPFMFFFEFLTTYETQKNDAFFCVLF